ncbi:MAG: hypothetical protein FWG84_07520 [Bacteroidales bacterium]|nr:hypothetical protein [Bacteroidales bacterium]
MKSKNRSFPFILLVFIILPLFSLNAQTDEYNYSVKNRWTLKASYSRYKTAYDYGVFVSTGDFFDVWQNRKMSNFKVETNYGVNRFIETGIYTGFQHYEWVNLDEVKVGEEVPYRESFAPLFGVNLNFHILPFLVPSEKCRWDLYLTAKYGGCYLPHREWETSDNSFDTDSKYRHEYGLGIGAGYYFKNIIGLFAESSVGQFSYFPRYAESNFRFRIGVAAKF